MNKEGEEGEEEEVEEEEAAAGAAEGTADEHPCARASSRAS